MHDFELTPSLV